MLIFFLIIFQIQAQNTSTWFTMDNGLPQNSIKDIIKDKYGFIWLSTDGGIVRYDGAGFLTYSKLPVSNLHFGGFYGDIAQDSIIIYNDYEANKILISKRAPKIIKKKYPDYTGKITYRSGQLLERPKTSEIDAKHHCIIKTTGGEYNIKHHEVFYTDKKKGKKKLYTLAGAEHYNIFLGSDDTLFITDSKNRETHTFFGEKVITDKTPTLFNDPDTRIFWQQPTNQIVVVHKDDIYLAAYYKHKLRLQFLTHYENFGNYRFGCIYYDTQYNRLYIGSSVKGLNIIQLPQFYTAQKKIPFVDDVSYASLPFTNSTIIDALGYEYDKNGLVKDHQFGSYEKYYMLYDQDRNIMYKQINMIFRRHKSSGYTTADTILFAGKTSNGIFKTTDFYAVSETDFINSSLHLFTTSRLDKKKFSFSYPGVINNLVHYNKNELLVGSTHGLYITSLHTKKTVLIKKINVKNIVKTKDGNVWITTNKDGFFLLKQKKLLKAPLDQHRYLESAHYIIDDPYGYYWISSNNGLFKISRQQLLKSMEDKNSEISYYRFTKNDGLLTNEFNGGSAPNAYLLPNKEMVFPSMEGFVFFDPAQVRTHYPEENKVFIERAKIDNGEIIDFQRHVILQNDYKSADIFIDLPYYADPSNLKIEVQVENLSQKWEKIEAGNQRKYTLKSLDPGNYTLHIRVLLSPNGQYEYHTITFEIKALFYQTKVFKFVLFFVLFLIVVLIILTTTKYIRKRNKILKKEVSNISTELLETSQHLEKAKSHIEKESENQKKFMEAVNHDITTPVKYIAMLAQKLNEEKNVEVQKKYFEGIHQTSEELYKFTLSLKEYDHLYTAKKDSEDGFLLKELFESKQKLFEKIATEKNNLIEIYCKKDIKCFINKGIIACIIHNLTDNAVKYSYNSMISLSAEETNEKITIQIADTGNGMTDEQLAHYNHLSHIPENENANFSDQGLGLQMVIQLIKKIEAEIQFKRNIPKGTIIEINIYKSLIL